MSERQYAFFRTAMAMGEAYELKKMGEALRRLGPQQVEKLIEEAIEAGDSKVMITDRGYIDISEVQSLATTAREPT